MESTVKRMVSSSPHIKAHDTTRRIMTEVCVALVPALVAGVVFFGLYALVIVAVCVAAAVAGEFLFNVVTRRKQSVGDCSAVVTGLILGLNLPPATPIYVPIVGGLFASVVVKMLFGGIGKNFANPAATARVFLLLAWSVQMSVWVPPLTYTGNGIFRELTKYFAGIGSVSGVNGMISATPLSVSGEVNVLHMFLGNVGGCIGETSALALLIGGVYLVIRRIIDWRIPLIYLGSVALFTLVFAGSYTEILPQLLGGGLMLGAFFMATDYSTSPDTANGTIIYALGLGLLTVLLRRFTNMSEGVSYAIVLMNLVVPLLDKFILPAFFGTGKKPILTIVLVCLLAAGAVGLGVGGGVSYAREVGAVAAFYGEELSYRDRLFQSKSDIGRVNAVYRASDGALIFNVTGLKGYAPDSDRDGYVGMLIAVKDGRIQKLEITDHNQNPPEEGGQAVFSREYLAQYVGKSLRNFAVGEDVDKVAGATLTSNAINNAVNKVAEVYRGAFGGEAAQ